MLTLVAAGFGVAILPAWVRQTRHANLVYRPLADIRPIVDLALAWVAEGQTDATRDFLASARRFVRGASDG